MMKNFISVDDVTSVENIIQECLNIKKNPLTPAIGSGKTLGLLFFNPSLRTRLSTQKAAYNLGMSVICLNVKDDGWVLEFEDGSVMDQGAQEHINDAVAVISQYCDILGVRTFAGLKNKKEDYEEKVLQKFLDHATVPVISLESAIRHPLQSLTDLVTIRESGIKKPKIVVSWAPHPRALPQAVTNSFLEWITKTDAEVVLTHPKGYELDEHFMKGVTLDYNQEHALDNADFVYTKNWSTVIPYGQILSAEPSWMITQEKMALTNNGKFMHCLPVRRNVIVSDSVIDNSIVISQAANRVFAAQAVLKSILSS